MFLGGEMGAWRSAGMMAAACCTVFSLSARADDKVVRLTSLEWPPYTTQAMPHGVSEAVVSSAFSAMGYHLVTDFLPWQRATAMGKAAAQYAGYYPEYKSETLSDCLLSASIGESPLGLVERKDANSQGKRLDDLAGVTIGTVAGYVNDAEFDRRVMDGRLHVEKATDDLTNLRKVAHNRIPAAVIDRNVMQYLISTDQGIAALRDQLTFDGGLLAAKTLHVCFRKDEDGRKMAGLFNEGLRKISVQAVTDSYFRAYMQ